jgi:hypothetical protein
VTRVPIPRLAGPPTDGRITLRPWNEADVPAVTKAYADPEIQRWMEIPATFEAEYARKYLEGREESRRLGQTLEMADRRRPSAHHAGLGRSRGIRRREPPRRDRLLGGAAGEGPRRVHRSGAAAVRGGVRDKQGGRDDAMMFGLVRGG